MEISKLWENYNFPECETCKKTCAGHLQYDNLCSNINYLKEYGKKNYIKNKKSFEELKKIMTEKHPTIFSFGCGIGLDFLGAKEVFEQPIKYYGIDECKWEISKTDAFKTFTPRLPDPIKFNIGSFLLNGKQNNLVLCFFNSLFIISENTNLDRLLFLALKNQEEFYFVCDFTINSNFHMPSTEQKFINSLIKNLKPYFKINRFDILDGKGIIVKGKK